MSMATRTLFPPSIVRASASAKPTVLAGAPTLSAIVTAKVVEVVTDGLPVSAVPATPPQSDGKPVPCISVISKLSSGSAKRSATATICSPAAMFGSPSTSTARLNVKMPVSGSQSDLASLMFWKLMSPACSGGTEITSGRPPTGAILSTRTMNGSIDPSARVAERSAKSSAPLGHSAKRAALSLAPTVMVKLSLSVSMLHPLGSSPSPSSMVRVTTSTPSGMLSSLTVKVKLPLPVPSAISRTVGKV